MASDGNLRSALWFTTKFTVITTVLTFALGFGLALLVRRVFKGVGFLRSSHFIPVVIGYAVASYIWVWLFNDSVGSSIRSSLGWAFSRPRCSGSRSPTPPSSPSWS